LARRVHCGWGRGLLQSLYDVPPPQMDGCAQKDNAPRGGPQCRSGVVKRDLSASTAKGGDVDGYVNAPINDAAGYCSRRILEKGHLVHKDDVLFENRSRPFRLWDPEKRQLAKAQAQLGMPRQRQSRHSEAEANAMRKASSRAIRYAKAQLARKRTVAGQPMPRLSRRL